MNPLYGRPSTHLFYLEDDDCGIDDLRQSWCDRNVFTPIGLKGALQRQLPDVGNKALLADSPLRAW